MKKTTLNILSLFVIAVLLVFSFASCKSSKQCDSSYNNAAIFIQANLHVSKKRSDSDKYINNKNIDRLNSELSKSANGKSTFYIDANPLFDDKDGNLSLDKTSDNAHLYAKYYTEWGEWICKETAKVLKERQS